MTDNTGDIDMGTILMRFREQSKYMGTLQVGWMDRKTILEDESFSVTREPDGDRILIIGIDEKAQGFEFTDQFFIVECGEQMLRPDLPFVTPLYDEYDKSCRYEPGFDISPNEFAGYEFFEDKDELAVWTNAELDMMEYEGDKARVAIRCGGMNERFLLEDVQVNGFTQYLFTHYEERDYQQVIADSFLFEDLRTALDVLCRRVTFAHHYYTNLLLDEEQRGFN